MHKELVKRLKEEADCPDNYPEDSCLMREAADAIEELSDLCASQSKDCSEAIAKYIELWKKQPHWIPVTERLPEHLTSVIVHRKDGGVFIWEYFDTSPTDECWIDDSMNVYSFYDVTHWMPLPEPPKENENG